MWLKMSVLLLVLVTVRNIEFDFELGESELYNSIGIQVIIILY